MPDTPQQIFHAVRALPQRERAAFLEHACEGDASLRAAVEALLLSESATEASGAPFDADQTATFAGEANDAAALALEHPGQTIDRYTLVRSLGEGGFGTVWLAEQTKPVRREVALKIIKLGMDTRDVIARFEAERQALAMMDHPGIAKVFDAGATETGRPYFVMEYAEGVPFTQYCAEQQLDLRARLRLFQRACQAVQHAHLKGVIHRDIKPSNVLVTEVDGEPVPKVIDFGIAKATQAELTEHTMFTQQGQVIGTPAYMSPEQASAAGEDIDTRSDVYALGVLLYEAMTGETPFNPRTLMSAGFEEIRRIIREVDPPRPSTRISKSGEVGDVGPRTPSGAIGSKLVGDIDWIVMKALEKDRARRYQTASGFAEDIQRFLDDEPVLASPPSARYKLGKFVKRNRATVVAASLLLGVLIAGAAGTTVGMVRALRAEGDARQAADIAEQARADEAAQAEIARTERDKARQVATFLREMLAGVDPAVAQGADTTLLRDVLDRTAARIGEELGDQPAVEAELRSVLATTYMEIQEFESADEHMRRSLALYERLHPEDHANVAQTLEALGVLLTNRGMPGEAERPQREALAMWRRLIDGDSDEISTAQRHLAITLIRQDKFEEAEALLLDALEIDRRLLGTDHPTIGVGLNTLANLKQRAGDYEEAELLYRQSLEIHRAALGERHPWVSTDLHNLGYVLAAQSKNIEAIETLTDSLDRGRALYPNGHEETASNLTLLAQLYRYDPARSASAVPLMQEAVEIYKQIYGDRSGYVADAAYELGVLHYDQRDYEAALAVFEDSVARYEEIHGEQHNSVAVSRQSVARAQQGLGRLEEAGAEYDQVLSIQTQVFGERHQAIAITLFNIGSLHQQLDDLDAAETAYLEAIEMLKAVGMERSRHIASCYERIGLLQESRGDLDAAIVTLRNALDIRRESEGPHARWTYGSSFTLAGLLIKRGGHEEAATLLEPCLEDPNRVIEAPLRARIQRRYAKALAGAERYADCLATLEACRAFDVESGQPSSEAAIETLEELIRVSQILHSLEPTAGHDERAQSWRQALNAASSEDPSDGT